LKSTLGVIRHRFGQLRQHFQPTPPIRNQHPAFVYTQFRYQDLHTFFGYYDRSPWSPDGARLLMGATELQGRLVKQGDHLMLLTFDFEQDEFVELSKTSAWNYQQGAQQQWINVETILYNDVDSGKYVTKLLNINQGKTAVLAPIATAAYHRKRKLGVAVDFERLRILESDYGYPLLQSRVNVLDIENCCLRLLDYASGSSAIIFGPNELVRVFPRAINTEKYDYWLNHPKFNPAGTKISFVVRSRLKNGSSTSPRANDLLVVDLESGDIRCVFENEQWSQGAHHPTWFDNDRILMNWRIDGRMRFVLFADAHEEYQIIPADDEGSGHPTVDSSHRFLVTDDYPWHTGRYQPLRLVDIPTGRSINLAEYHLPPSFTGPWRCDLHPRWRNDSLDICFDSAHDGRRSLMVASLSDVIAHEFPHA
jgi:hypothetical protein